MARSKLNPFGRIDIKPVLVVATPSGGIYFGSKNAIDPNTSPISLQEKQKKQREITLLILSAAETLAEEKQITPEEAREMLFPKTTDAGVEVQQVSLFDYLSKEQQDQYLALTQEAAEIPLKVATLMIRHRMLYSITLKSDAKAKAKQIEIQEPWFDFSVGDSFKFGDVVVKTVGSYDPESGLVDVEPLPVALKTEDTGFLLKDNKKSFVMGDLSWTEEQTKDLTSDCADGSISQIDAIYKFYLSEAGMLGTEDEGKLLSSQSDSNENKSEPSSTQTVLTGLDSIGDYNTSDVLTPA